MKKCPYCAEEIQDQAVKCKHCGSDLLKEAETPAPVQIEEKTGLLGKPGTGWHAANFGCLMAIVCVIGLILIVFFLR